MEILLLAIYSGFVWLIFIKLKLLPWTFVSQVIVVTIPIVALTIMILVLNVVAPSSHDVRVINYVVPIVPQVTGQVVEVPVQNNQFVRRGEVLLRLDSVPFVLRVQQLEAQLASTEGGIAQAREELAAAQGSTASLQAQLSLSERRVKQHEELVKAGAGNRFDLESEQSDVEETKARIAAANADEAKVRKRLGTRAGGSQAEIAETRSQLARAHWELSQTTVLAPADGWAINVQVRPGTMAVQLPFKPVMTFVEKEQQVYALFAQNELSKVRPGNEAEISLNTIPGKLIKCKVLWVIWAQGQGQLSPSGELPQPQQRDLPPGPFAVQLEPEDSTVFLAAGARGQGAIYTEHVVPIHLIRKVIVRVSAKLDYLILKLH
ncbi:MAG TPA: biotin/lipoyl-binding protein [Gemmatimonadales bacterium]|jgi:multidrug resistance efflux pump|nr:biotin/lipoyl-binding protein [Gemmatimonadales bacterium]